MKTISQTIILTVELMVSFDNNNNINNINNNNDSI